MTVQSGTQSNLDELLSNPVVLLKVTAPWCGYCRAIKPKIKRVMEEIGNKAIAIEVDLDETPEIKKRFEFQTIPALFFIKNGTIVKHTGTISEEEIRSTLEDMINS